MIRELRKKFIVITALALLGVVTILVASISGVNYYNNEKQLNTVLNILFENQGILPIQDKQAKMNHSINDKISNNMPKNRESFFTTRFCTVLFDENKVVQSIYADKIAALSETQIEEYANEIVGLKKAEGWINGYRYRLQPVDDGYMLVMLDGSTLASSVISVFIISIVVAIICYVITLLIVILCSKKVIRPVVESYEKQKQFITDASHELKTPLTIISANAEILSMSYGEDEWLKGIYQQTKNMRNMVNSMVMLAKLDEAHPIRGKEPFSLSDALYDTAMAFDGLCQNEAKQLTLHIQPGIFIEGQEEDIRTMICILMDNAVKYCDEYGTIDVTLKKDKHICLTISNTYKNLNNIALDRLFDRFYRVDKARTASGSFGLGLSIAHAIVQAHHGRIKAVGQEKSMISFRIRF